MIKKVLLTTFTIGVMTTTIAPVFAVSPTIKPTGETKLTPSPASTSEEKQQNLIDQINNLKEKVASKVAELRLVEKRGIIGVVNQSSDNKITVTDSVGTTRYVDVDELTKFSSSDSKSSFGISDITKGMTISVIGLYNKDSKRILARFVDAYTVPIFLTGQIVDLDKVNFTVTVATADQNKTTVDIENITKTATYTDADDLTKAGFSKLSIGERVHVMGYINKEDKKRVTATRLIAFPELPKNPKIAVPVETTNENETPTPASKTQAKP